MERLHCEHKVIDEGLSEALLDLKVGISYPDLIVILTAAGCTISFPREASKGLRHYRSAMLLHTTTGVHRNQHVMAAEPTAASLSRQW